jgi:hypothetical protein
MCQLIRDIGGPLPQGCADPKNMGRLHVTTNDIVAKFQGRRVQVLCVNTALLPLSLLEEGGFHEDVPFDCTC